MKLYIIKHKDIKTLPQNICAWSDCVWIGGKGIYAKSVHAFLKKKEAINFIKNHYGKYGSSDYEIVSFTNDK